MVNLAFTLVPVVVALVACTMSVRRSKQINLYFNDAFTLLNALTEIAVKRYETKYGRKPSVLVPSTVGPNGSGKVHAP